MGINNNKIVDYLFSPFRDRIWMEIEKRGHDKIWTHDPDVRPEKRLKKVSKMHKKLLSSRGIEPVTFALLARRSNQLS